MPRIVVFLLIFFCSQSYGQVLRHFNHFDLYWGEPYRDMGNVERILKTNEDDYISVINRTNFLNFYTDYKKRFYFEPIREYRPERLKKIKLFGDGERTYLEDFAILDDQLLIVSRRKEFFNKKVHLYYHFLDPDKTITENHGFHLETYSLKSSFSFDYLTVTNNFKKSRVGYLYTLPGTKEDFPTYSFGLFDSTYHISMQGTSIFPHRYKEMQFTESFITENGDFYILAEEFSYINGINGQGKEDLKKQLTVFKLKNGELTNFNVEHDLLLLKDIKIVAENNEIIFSGLYAYDNTSGIRGVFFIRMNQDGEVIQEEYSRFSANFMIQSHQTSGSITGKNDHFEEGLENYQMRELRKTSDGGYVGIAEHYDLEEMFSGTGAPGTSNRVDTYYYYNNIIVYKFDSTGRLLWNTNIPKNQHSINDGGYFLSYTQFFQDTSLYIVFNDNSKNYTDDGVYLNYTDPRTAHFNSWRNTVAVVRLDLTSGNYVRQAIGGKSLTDVVLVPRLCIENVDDNELFLYGKSGNKHRYGSLHFND